MESRHLGGALGERASCPFTGTTGVPMEIVRAIASEQRQGELDGIQCLPRFIMSRLQTA